MQSGVETESIALPPPSSIISTAVSAPTAPKRKRASSPSSEARAALRVRLSACSASDDFPSALAAIEEAREKLGTMPPPHAYNLLLNIASRARSVDSHLLDSAVCVFNDMIAARLALSEASYASIIRICALAGDVTQGSALLEQMKRAGLAPRLRSYAALVRAYAAQPDLPATRALFADMAQLDVVPGQGEHAALIRALRAAAAEPVAETLAHLRTIAAEQPLFEDELAAAVEAAITSDGTWATERVTLSAAGVCPATGRKLRSIDVSPDELAALRAQCTELAGDRPEAAARFNAFREWLAARGADFDVLIDGPNVGFFGQNYESGALMYSQIEAVRAHFHAQGKKVLIVIGERWLAPRSFSDPAMRRTVKRKMNFYAARARGELTDYSSRFGGAHVGAAAGAGAAAAVATGDGARLAPAFSRSQVWNAPSEESHAGESSPQSSSSGSDSDSGRCAIGAGAFVRHPEHGVVLDGPTEPIDVTDTVADDAVEDTRRAADLISLWQREGSVYSVPRGFNDDWFWMLAAFSSAVPARVLLVSNDFMRDHHFQMLAPRAFLTWRDRHQVRFAFSERSDGARRLHRLDLKLPLPFSLRVQEGLDGLTLHAPLAQGASRTTNEWLACWKKGEMK